MILLTNTKIIFSNIAERLIFQNIITTDTHTDGFLISIRVNRVNIVNQLRSHLFIY